MRPSLRQVEFLTSLLGFKASGNRASSTADSAEVAGLSLPGCTQQDFPGKYPPQVTAHLTHHAVLFRPAIPALLSEHCAGQQSMAELLGP